MSGDLGGKDVRVLVRIARRQGWRVHQTRGGHVAFDSPTGGRVIAPGTSSSRRGLKNLRADLKRLGLQ